MLKLYVNTACLSIHITYKVKTPLVPCSHEVLLLSRSLSSSVFELGGFNNRPRGSMNSSILNADSYLFKHFFLGKRAHHFLQFLREAYGSLPASKGLEVLPNRLSLFNRLY